MCIYKFQQGGFQGTSNQQSRLNQWKLPVLEKDINAESSEFSRAPGATKQNITSNSGNIGSLGLQNDGYVHSILTYFYQSEAKCL